jgi:tryptophan synthase beta chain
MEVILQEVSTEQRIPIPEEVRDVYRQWRPTPLHRARRLERELDTPARIFYKYEGVSPTGSHKPNTAVAQAYYNAREGVKRIATETGAGAMGLVAGVRRRALRARDRRLHGAGLVRPEAVSPRLMEAFGARVRAEPVEETASGRAVLAEHPDSTGSLGIAISEAVEQAAQARRHEVRARLGAQPRPPPPDRDRRGGDRADGSRRGVPRRPRRLHGRRSNFSGLVFPFLGQKLRGGAELRVIAVEPAACPTSRAASSPTTSATPAT